MVMKEWLESMILTTVVHVARYVTDGEFREDTPY